MRPTPLDYAGIILTRNLKAEGIPADDLGCGVVDLMIDRRDGDRHGEVRLVVDEEDNTAVLSTVWYEADGDDGLHPVDDDEHGTFNVDDVTGIAAAVREITGGAA